HGRGRGPSATALGIEEGEQTSSCRRGENGEIGRPPRYLPDLLTRRRREHCKNPNTAGQGCVGECSWLGSGGLTAATPGITSRICPAPTTTRQTVQGLL